jgi:hypothetical protein
VCWEMINDGDNEELDFGRSWLRLKRVKIPKEDGCVAAAASTAETAMLELEVGGHHTASERFCQVRS